MLKLLWWHLSGVFVARCWRWVLCVLLGLWGVVGVGVFVGVGTEMWYLYVLVFCIFGVGVG